MRTRSGATPRAMHPALTMGCLLCAAVLAMLGASCRAPPRGEPTPEVAGGEPERGIVAIERFGCGGCHQIPGIRSADGLVGPPLTSWSRRVYIAGRLPNEPSSLVRWIMQPQTFEPGGAMPNMGVSESDARDIAAYLYTIH